MYIRWTAQDLLTLKRMSKEKTDTEIFEFFKGRFTLSAITKQRQRLKIKKSDNGRPKKKG